MRVLRGSVRTLRVPQEWPERRRRSLRPVENITGLVCVDDLGLLTSVNSSLVSKSNTSLALEVSPRFVEGVRGDTETTGVITNGVASSTVSESSMAVVVSSLTFVDDVWCEAETAGTISNGVTSSAVSDSSVAVFLSSVTAIDVATGAVSIYLLGFDNC